jgi:hypothetical protein
MGMVGLLAITRCRQSYRIGMTQPGEDLHELDGPVVAETRSVEAPDADAYEQAMPAIPARLPAELRLTSEVNEADAYEQSQVVDLDDDYR